MQHALPQAPRLPPEQFSEVGTSVLRFAYLCGEAVTSRNTRRPNSGIRRRRKLARALAGPPAEGAGGGDDDGGGGDNGCGGDDGDNSGVKVWRPAETGGGGNSGGDGGDCGGDVMKMAAKAATHGGMRSKRNLQVVRRACRRRCRRGALAPGCPPQTWRLQPTCGVAAGA
ncbi:Protein of unknown function [Gryllus bimaculatus]|nr:Protein of unknown function [Gryllus bimaculatus]